MLLKFKHIRSREAINRQMMMKFNDILVQYCKEVTDRDPQLRAQGTVFPPHSERPWCFPTSVCYVV